jgi:hypothetical protein
MRNLFLGVAAATLVMTVSAGADQALPSAWLNDGVYRGNTAPIADTVQFLFGGRHYCWYDDGWHGPGWYWCGYAWRDHFGWGGVYGWNGWHGGHGGVTIRGGGFHGGGHGGGFHGGGGHGGGFHGGGGHGGGGHGGGGGSHGHH